MRYGIKKLLAIGLAVSLALGFGQGAMTLYAAAEAGEEAPDLTLPSTETWAGNEADSFAGGTGTEEDPYQIANGAQLAYLSKLSNTWSGNAEDGYSWDTFEGKYFILTEDIDLKNRVFIPIANGSFCSDDVPPEYQGSTTNVTKFNTIRQGYPFRGVIDGNGKTIKTCTTNYNTSGYKYAAAEDIMNNVAYTNLVGCLGGTIKNLNLSADNRPKEDATVRYASSMVKLAYRNARILQCTSDVCVESTSPFIRNMAIVAGQDGDIPQIIGCVNYGPVQERVNACGIAPYGHIERCVNYGSVSTTNGSSSCIAGGIAAGQVSRIAIYPCEVVGCINYGSVTADSGYAGGIVGRPKGDDQSVVLAGNINRGSISGATTGGIIGEANGTARIYGNYNEGTASTGAIVGSLDLNNADNLQYNYFKIVSGLSRSGIGTNKTGVGLDETATVKITGLETLDREAVWNMNTGKGQNANTGTWGMNDGGVYHILDEEVEDRPGPVVRVTSELGAGSHLLVNGGEAENGTAYVNARDEVTVTLDEGYGFTTLRINRQGVGLESGQTSYSFSPEAEKPEDLKVEVQTRLLSVNRLKQQILALEDEITTESGPAIASARKAWDGLTDAEREALGKDVEEALQAAEAVFGELKKFTVTLSADRYDWTGEEIKPQVQSVIYMGGEPATTLQADDYSVSYEDNIDPGTGIVEITLKAPYPAGKLIRSFTIEKQPEKKPGNDPAAKPDDSQNTAPDGSQNTGSDGQQTPAVPVALQGAEVTLSHTSVSHTGKALEPSVTVKKDGKTLEQGSDYTVSYSGNVNPGKAKVTVNGANGYTGTVEKEFIIKAAKGKTYAAGDLKYKVTNADSKKGAVTVSGVKKKTLAKVTVPDTVRIGVYTYQVTAIGDGVFKNCKSLAQATVGKNVTSVGREAFSGAKKLKKITVKGKNIKKVGAKALKGIHKNAVVKVPSAKVKAYKKLFKGKGQKSTVKVKK
ncbi:MAG TPA: hypothetical protein DF613_15345 [Lachnospiraceae bacterium]|nr:hypothetical protein [Lachnospiraceae bacterium]